MGVGHSADDNPSRPFYNAVFKWFFLLSTAFSPDSSLGLCFISLEFWMEPEQKHAFTPKQKQGKMSIKVKKCPISIKPRGKKYLSS